MSRRDGLRDRWRDQHVIPNTQIGDACKVLLLVLATRMTDRGVVSVPQDQLAQQLGIDTRRVKARIAEARAANLLDKLGGGYRGRTAEYIAVLGTAARHPFGVVERCSECGMGAVFRHPINVTLSGADSALMGTAERTPNARALLTDTRKGDDRPTESGASTRRMATAKPASTRWTDALRFAPLGAAPPLLWTRREQVPA